MNVPMKHVAGYVLTAALGAAGGAQVVDDDAAAALSQGARQAVFDRGDARSQPAILGTQILTIVEDVAADTPAGEEIPAGDVGVVLMARVDAEDFVPLAGRVGDVLQNALTSAGVAADERIATADVLAALTTAATAEIPETVPAPPEVLEMLYPLRADEDGNVTPLPPESEGRFAE